MNEQINILAEQAGLHCDGTPDCWDQEAIARFAQLIVYDVLSDLTNDDSLGAARIESIRRLAERYGVAR